MDDYLFIPHSSTTGRISSARSRSTIRAHVKRRGHQQTSIQPSRSLQPPTSSASASSAISNPPPSLTAALSEEATALDEGEDSFEDDFRRGTGDAMSLSGVIKSIEQLGRRFCGTAHSFAYAGVRVRPRACYLFKQYAAQFNVVLENAAQPVDLIGHPYICYVAIQQNSPALLHAICYTAASHEVMARARTSLMTINNAMLQDAKRNAAYYQAVALHLLGLSLGSLVLADAALETRVCCVIVLLAEGCVTGDVEAVRAHSEGLKRLVGMCGGEEALQPELATEAWLVDVKASHLRQSKPLLALTPALQQLIDDVPNSPAQSHDVLPFAVKTCTAFLDGPLADRLSPQLTRYIIYTRHLKGALSGFRRRHSRLRPRIVDDFVTLEHGLICLPHEQSLSPLEDCIRVAILLYINTGMWKIPLYFAWVGPLAAQLRRLVETLVADGMLAQFPGLTLWMCLLGRHASDAHPDQETKMWWARGVWESASALGVEEWEATMGVVEGFCYAEKVYALEWEALFEEAMVVGGGGGESELDEGQ